MRNGCHEDIWSISRPASCAQARVQPADAHASRAALPARMQFHHDELGTKQVLQPAKRSQRSASSEAQPVKRSRRRSVDTLGSQVDWRSELSSALRSQPCRSCLKRRRWKNAAAQFSTRPAAQPALEAVEIAFRKAQPKLRSQLCNQIARSVIRYNALLPSAASTVRGLSVELKWSHLTSRVARAS